MRSPGAAYGRVAQGVVGGVACHRHDERVLPFPDLPEELFLEIFEVDDGKRTPALFRGQNISGANGNGELDGFHLGFVQQGVPRAWVGECRAEHRVGVLGGPA